ncbi:TetR family transcriptional regulator [Gynuella sp.]|uniref:TetR family transcriptional regulator n=1 Tax=Gynuella sp. TaxID=2969146 RepID=UPI003D12D4D5
MARKTKEAAQETYQALLDAAENEFSRHGVSATTLNDIAHAAGVTRGALYHYFGDKQALIAALIERCFYPMEQLTLSQCAETSMLKKLHACCLGYLTLIAQDRSAQNVQTITMLKCEMVDVHDTIHEHYRDIRNEIYQEMKQDLEQAISNGDLPDHIDPHQVAVALFSITQGIVYSWLADPNYCDLIRDGMAAIDTYLAGLTRPL